MSEGALGGEALSCEAPGDEAVGDEAVGDEAVGDEAVGDWGGLVVDIGGTKVLAALVQDGAIVARTRLESRGLPAEVLVSDVALSGAGDGEARRHIPPGRPRRRPWHN